MITWTRKILKKLSKNSPFTPLNQIALKTNLLQLLKPLKIPTSIKLYMRNMMLLFAVTHGNLSPLMISLTMLDVGGFTASNETLMVPFTSLKHVLLLKTYTNALKRTIMKPSTPLLSQQLFIWCLVLFSAKDCLLNS